MPVSPGGPRSTAQETLSYTILEEPELFTLVGNVKSDGNLGERYTVEELNKVMFISSSNPYFTLDMSYGDIFTTARIDREDICPVAVEHVKCALNLNVTALILDDFRLLEIIKISIELADLNDHFPQFPEPEVTLNVSQSAIPGTSFVIPAASDLDSREYGIKRYELLPVDSKFDLDMHNNVDESLELRLILKEVLDQEEQGYYDMKVVAYDSGQPPKAGSMNIHVEVQGTNNKPVFTNATYEVSVYENIPIGSTILQVRASQVKSYSFSKRTNGNLGHLFGIRSDTGEIYIKGELDHEESLIYHLWVLGYGQEPDSTPAQVEVIVKLMDRNDHSPQITINTLAASGTDTAEITENARPGTFVAHMTVIDEDADENGEFTCSLRNDHFALEEIYPGEYKIINVITLDREMIERYDIQITCRDNGTPPQFSTKNLQVVVLDLNDHWPIFQQEMYHATIVENNLVDAFLLNVNARDLDIGQNADIRYILDDAVTNLLTIGEKSGRITAKVPFDHEEMEELSFTVIAMDHGNPALSSRASVIITIQDTNDEKPVFTQESYSFDIGENIAPGSLVGVVSAVDLDSELYNQLEFSLVPTHASVNSFTIQPNTGEIRTSVDLDREERAEYSLIVAAVDLGYPAMSSTAGVLIHIQDTNRYAPKFVYPSADDNTIEMSNLVQPGYEVTQVIATDKDIGVNGALTYGFFKGNEGGYFHIESLSGSITVAQSLEQIDSKQFELVIVARDQGMPQKSVLTILNINVSQEIPL